MEILEKIFGVGKELTTGQMCARAFVTFFITLVMIRVAGMRSIGKKTAFDSVITIMLGAVLSRVVVGASEFLPTVAAGATIVIVHRLVAIISLKSRRFENLVKGEDRQLFSNGEINRKAMTRSSITKKDLMESVRHGANLNSLDDVEEAYIESNGEISIVKKKK